MILKRTRGKDASPFPLAQLLLIKTEVLVDKVLDTLFPKLRQYFVDSFQKVVLTFGYANRIGVDSCLVVFAFVAFIVKGSARKVGFALDKLFRRQLVDNQYVGV